MNVTLLDQAEPAKCQTYQIKYRELIMQNFPVLEILVNHLYSMNDKKQYFVL